MKNDLAARLVRVARKRGVPLDGLVDQLFDEMKSAAQDSAARDAGESHLPLRASRNLRRAVADTHGRPAVLSVR